MNTPHTPMNELDRKLASMDRKASCPYCGAGGHGAVTQPTVTCTRHLWSVIAEMRTALQLVIDAENRGIPFTSASLAIARHALNSTKV